MDFITTHSLHISNDGVDRSAEIDVELRSLLAEFGLDELLDVPTDIELHASYLRDMKEFSR